MKSRRLRSGIGLLAAVGVSVVASACGAPDTAGDRVDISATSAPGPTLGLSALVPQRDRVAAPVLSGATLDGGSFSSLEHRGHVLVVNLWASWCDPCRREAPELRSLAEDESGRGVDMVGLNVRDSREAAVSFAADFGLTYPMVPDTDRGLQLALAQFVPASSVPSTVVIDRRGRVAATVIGAVDGTRLRELLARLLRE